MTHQYTVATGGIILGGGESSPRTAVAWAHGTILAVGDDATVRAISRGDSTFVDLAGYAVSPGRDAAAARAQLVASVRDGAPARVGELEPGSSADLLIWSHDPGRLAPDQADTLRVVAMVRDGHLAWQPGEGPS